MATNFASNIATNQIAARQTRVSFEHRFFLTIAVLFPLITVIGFAPTYYFKSAFSTPPLPSGLVHAHGMTMSLWIVLFSVQAYLISSKRVKLHMTLGIFGVALAIAMVVLGVLTGYASAARGAGFPGYTPIEFFIVPIGDMLTFAVLFAAAIYSSEECGQPQTANARYRHKLSAALDRPSDLELLSGTRNDLVLWRPRRDRDNAIGRRYLPHRETQSCIRRGRIADGGVWADPNADRPNRNVDQFCSLGIKLTRYSRMQTKTGQKARFCLSNLKRFLAIRARQNQSPKGHR